MASPQPSTTVQSTTFTYPPHHSFPPFYTLQPNQTTLTRQLSLWSQLILSFCSHHHTFKLSPSSAATLPLFSNQKIHRSLDALSIKKTPRLHGKPRRRVPRRIRGQREEYGLGLVEECGEWADEIARWVDETGQKGVVLTIYELRESEAVERQEWVGMDEDMLRRCLDVLVKKGRAQVFGQADGSGVKFF
ncbi:unnamed protein product [Aureobasidium mustum]|uniref:ESCRT-II complex subunit VPS25 n=1 Tax=Aureobasidium mustum TaxID=2773714 RepID=A0A9N8K590_9PEZI|nr:unnamed protein product [Aureobasidium mustum]